MRVVDILAFHQHLVMSVLLILVVLVALSWRRAWQPTSVFLLGESHGQRSLVGYSPWGRKESGMTEQLTLSEVVNHLATSTLTHANQLIPSSHPQPSSLWTLILPRATIPLP